MPTYIDRMELIRERLKNDSSFSVFSFFIHISICNSNKSQYGHMCHYYQASGVVPVPFFIIFPISLLLSLHLSWSLHDETAEAVAEMKIFYSSHFLFSIPHTLRMQELKRHLLWALIFSFTFCYHLLCSQSFADDDNGDMMMRWSLLLLSLQLYDLRLILRKHFFFTFAFFGGFAMFSLPVFHLVLISSYILPGPCTTIVIFSFMKK